MLMKPVEPVVLARAPVRLEPMTLDHVAALGQAARDGELWKLVVTSVPEPGGEARYVQQALHMQAEGTRLPFVVRLVPSGQIIGSTSYHDIVVAAARVEIGYTWYGQSHWRSAVNSTCKWLLMQHAFDTLGAKVVGWRTDHLNLRSQQAIERLGAHKDGVIRHHAPRRDGSVRDTVMYSMTSDEWPAARERLQASLPPT